MRARVYEVGQTRPASQSTCRAALLRTSLSINAMLFYALPVLINELTQHAKKKNAP